MPGDAKDAEATFTLNLDGNIGAKSKEDIEALEELRERIAKSTEAIREASAANRSLRGTSSQVTDARAKLKALLDSERDAVSRANVELLKQGTTYERLTKDAKALAAARAKVPAMPAAPAAPVAAADPLAKMKERFDNTQTTSDSRGISLGGAAKMAGLGVVALTGAVVAGVGALAKWTVGAADAARSMQIMRLAATGNAESARNLGTQVDDLATKISTPKEEINKLAVELARTRLTGPAIVDTLNAVGRASDAMGDDVGRAIQDVITRGQMWNRFQLNPLELQGKGVGFNDVAGELAANLKIGVAQAKQALMQGTVTVDQGAKAMRQAVEKRFGEVNAAKLISVDGIVKTLHENLQGLAKNVHIEAVLKPVSELVGMFSQSTVVGRALADIVERSFGTLGSTLQASLPALKGFVKQGVIAGLQIGIAFLQVRNVLRDLDNQFGIIKGTLEEIGKLKDAVFGKTEERNVQAPGTLQNNGFGQFAFKSARDDAQLRVQGMQAADGLAAGIKAGTPSVGAASEQLADSVKTQFADKMQIHSPSKVFAGYGEDTAEGFEQGVRRGAPSAADATSGLAGAPDGGATASGGGASSAGGAVVVNVNLGGIKVTAAAAQAKEIQAKVSTPSFLAEMTKAVVDVLKGAGIPTQTVPSP